LGIRVLMMIMAIMCLVDRGSIDLHGQRDR
jgi:hypothetical protein